MVAPIKQKVTVNADGNIVIRAPDLPPGTTAEVHVYVDQPATPTPPAPPADPFLTALDALQKSMNLTREDAERWAAENRTLREWNRPRE